MDDFFPISPQFVDKGANAEKLNNFKEKIKKEHTLDFFNSAEDLADKVLVSLIQELPKYDFKLGKKNEDDMSEETIKTIKNFIAMPKLYYDKVISFKAQLGDYERANKRECNAFSYNYGATVKRPIKATSEIINNEMKLLKFVYAENENGIESLNIPSDREIIITLRTIHGKFSYEEPIYEVKYIDAEPLNPYSVNINSLGVSNYINGRTEKIKTGTKVTYKLRCSFEFVSIE